MSEVFPPSGIVTSSPIFKRSHSLLVKADSNFLTTFDTLPLEKRDEYLCSMLQAGADFTSTNNIKQTPLHLAADGNLVRSLALLLSKPGVNIDVQDQVDQTPVLLATLRNNHESLEMLLAKGCNPNIKNSLGGGPIHYAISNNYQESIKALLEKNADPNIKGLKEWPGHLAMLGGKTSTEAYNILNLLLQKKLDIKVKSSKKETLLHVAVYMKMHKCIELLVAAGADITKRSKTGDGATPLHYAAHSDDEKALKIMLTASTKPETVINTKDNSGKTPLHVSVERDNYSATEILLSHKADVRYKDDANKTPLYYAVKNGTRMTKLLLEYGACDIGLLVEDEDNPICAAMMSDNMDSFKIIVEHLENKDHSFIHQPYLHFAVRNCCYKYIDSLILHGADVQQQDNTKKIPMEIAIEKRSPSVIKAIMDACIEESKSSPSHYTLKYNCLYSSENSWPETDLIHKMNLEFPRNDVILQHPLITTFIGLKSRKMEMLGLLCALGKIVVFLSAFIFLYYYTKCLFSGKFGKHHGTEAVNMSCLNYSRSNSTLSECDCLERDKLWHFDAWLIWISLSPLGIINEVTQYRDFPRQYIRDVENLYDLLLIFSSVLLCPYFVSTIAAYQKVFAITCMIGCGLNFMIVIGRVCNNWELHIMMFRKILKKSLTLMIPYSAVVGCYCFVFNSILEGSDGYENSGYSFIKSMSMMLGEIDEDTLKLTHGVLNDYIITAVITSFIFIIVIVLMNLMTALAVDVSNKFRRDALFNITQNKLLYLHQIEKSLKLRLLKRLQKRFSLKPELHTVEIIECRYNTDAKAKNTDKYKLINRIYLHFGWFQQFRNKDTGIIQVTDSSFYQEEIEHIKAIIKEKMKREININDINDKMDQMKSELKNHILKQDEKQDLVKLELVNMMMDIKESITQLSLTNK